MDDAWDDLEAVLEFLIHEGVDEPAAIQFVDTIVDHCINVARSNFQLGRERSELGASIRCLPHRKYLIFFRYSGDRLEVVRVVEGHRDVDALFDISRL